MTPSLHRRLLLGLATLPLLPSRLRAAQPFVPPQAKLPLAATPIGRMDLAWWRERHQAKLKELASAKPDLIFLGDSITQDWELTGPPAWRDFYPAWQRFYGDRNAVNLGFKGDTTASLLWRIRNGEVSGIAPKAAVILIGANNLGKVHWSAEDTVTGIRTIVSDLRQRLPAARLLLLGILPSQRSDWVTLATQRINASLGQIYKSDGEVAFMDISALFMRGSALNTTLFYDPLLSPPEPPLHPTMEGQVLMAKAIEPLLATMLKDQVHS
jgi:lysophospholipase L1-like esterase